MPRKMLYPAGPTTCYRHLHKAPREKDALFKAFAAGTHCIILQMDLSGKITFFNDYAQRFFDFKLGEILGKNIVGTIVPEKNGGIVNLESMLSGIQDAPDRYSSIETENIRRDGERVWILWSNKVLTDAGGKNTGILSIGNDITKRRFEEDLIKECCASLEHRVNERTEELTTAYEELQRESQERQWAEAILKKSEEKYRLVVENAAEAIVVIQDHHVKYFNPRTLRIMNLPAERVRDRPVDDFIHPEDRDMARQRRLRMVKGESFPMQYELRIRDADGVTRWLELHSVLITWMGRPAILAFFNNISERKRAEQEVKVYGEQLRALTSELSLAEEKERRRLATDLHDHIGQTLAIVNIKLRQLRTSMNTPACSSVLAGSEQLGAIQGLVEQTIQHTKSLTFQLSPPILYELGFVATLEWFGELIQKEHGIAVEFHDDGNDKPLERDVSVLLFQAVRELFMNVVKHSGAKKVWLSISRGRDVLQIDVVDDGVGFDEEKIGKTTFGFFSTRERLKHVSGSMEIETCPGGGTRISLKAPLKVDKPIRAGVPG